MIVWSEYHYPGLVKNLSEHDPTLGESALHEADDQWFEAQQLYYQKRDELLARGGTEFEQDLNKQTHALRLQRIFERWYGPDTWDDRNELYPRNIDDSP